MPNLTEHQAKSFTKILLIGDSKAGKTGALVSLVKAGYELFILDYDNGLDVLGSYVKKECPALASKVEFRTLRDDYTINAAGIHPSKPTAFVDGIKLLDKWKYPGTDFGVPAKWGEKRILVLDSLTFFSDAAFEWRQSIAPPTSSGKYDIRAVYKDAQDAVENTLALLTGEGFGTNVIVIAHVKYMEAEGAIKGYPVSVGSALSPAIPRYFNNYFRFVTKGGKRKIQTETSPMFDLANARPFDMPKEFDIENGLADIFSLLRK